MNSKLFGSEIVPLTVLGYFVLWKYWGEGGASEAPLQISAPKAAKLGTRLRNCAKRKASVLFFIFLIVWYSNELQCGYICFRFRLANFHGVVQAFEQYPRDWHVWYTSPEPETAPLPGKYNYYRFIKAEWQIGPLHDFKGIGQHCSQFKKSELHGPTHHQKIWWGIKMNVCQKVELQDYYLVL